MNTQSILVIDDEPEMRAALSHVLCRNGYSVSSASNGREALEIFATEAFGAVITDMRMPEMSGIQILGEIKKLCPDVPVIMMTAYGTINNAVEAMKKGASDYILKPFSAEMLESTVKKVFEKSKRVLQLKNQHSSPKNNLKNRLIVGDDSKMLALVKCAENIAPTNSTVLILGESGTGKEMLAAHIHQNSARSLQPYVAINCAALPENLAESELFGHEKGAFTGASNRKVGRFELADHGTLVLDEISEMPLPLQAKLLRALQEREIDRVGGGKPVPVDVRIIAISNVDLKKAVSERKFREDLYYRINVVPLTIPPLRERRSDIPVLAENFLHKYCEANNRPVMRLADESVSLLLQCEWKGNVRELENSVERAVIMATGDVLLPKHFLLENTADLQLRENNEMPLTVGLSVREMEKTLIFKTLEEVNDNRTHAARILGLSIRTLRNKLKEYQSE
jgi:DNA-binding NtrC family response regulator